jgi:cytosine/adenosine deaminase-related metal-dependent hydrolase
MMSMEDRIGSLTVGKQADIILIRTDDLNIRPVNDPVNSIVFYANASNIDTVYIAGELRKKNGKLIYKNLSNVMEKLERSGEKILGNTNAN